VGNRAERNRRGGRWSSDGEMAEGDGKMGSEGSGGRQQ
jgi:hypothetical protein